VPGWDDFFEAQVGASAALTGLLFVGISLNMAKIVAIVSLPDRALKALCLLVTILVVSTLFLVPGQPASWLAAEVLITALGGGGAVVALAVKVRLRTDPKFRRSAALEVATVAGIAALYVAAGALLLLGVSGGTYLVVPAIILSFLMAVLDSWVLLVEINR
jgi:hypothetical protein